MTTNGTELLFGHCNNNLVSSHLSFAIRSIIQITRKRILVTCSTLHTTAGRGKPLSPEVVVQCYPTDMNTIVDSILKYNAGREPEQVTLKYWAMRQDAFAFMRGTCHLFYQDWPASDKQFNDAPLAWITGDLHLENFGCYKGDNRLVYFDLNDFDEAVLAPATWELGRLLTSIMVVAKFLLIPKGDVTRLCQLGLDSYAATLMEGKARWLERETAKGMIWDLLNPLTIRNRKTFLGSRTKLRKGKRCIKVDGKRALALEPQEKANVMAFVEEYAQQQPNPDFYRPLDAARRIAGTGSLGIARYVILVEGRGSPDFNYLIDLKEAIPSALKPYLRHKQPKWQSEAHRIVSVQRWAQAIAPAFLSAVTFQEKPFVFKGLQPTQDRLALERWDDKLKRLEQVIQSMGEIVAWSHLRSGGRSGSAIADEWIKFGNRRHWQSNLLKYATSYAPKIEADWEKYCGEYDRSGKTWSEAKS